MCYCGQLQWPPWFFTNCIPVSCEKHCLCMTNFGCSPEKHCTYALCLCCGVISVFVHSQVCCMLINRKWVLSCLEYFIIFQWFYYNNWWHSFFHKFLKFSQCHTIAHHVSFVTLCFQDGRRPLSYAAFFGRIDCIHLLTGHKAEVNFADNVRMKWLYIIYTNKCF